MGKQALLESYTTRLTEFSAGHKKSLNTHRSESDIYQWNSKKLINSFYRSYVKSTLYIILYCKGTMNEREYRFNSCGNWKTQNTSRYIIKTNKITNHIFEAGSDTMISKFSFDQHSLSRKLSWIGINRKQNKNQESPPKLSETNACDETSKKS